MSSESKINSTYTPSHHFRDVLLQYQGKESREIPPEVLSELMQYFKEHPDTKITLSSIKNALTKLSHYKYRDNAPKLYQKITGRTVPSLSDTEMKQAISLFQKVIEKTPHPWPLFSDMVPEIIEKVKSDQQSSAPRNKN